MQPREVRTALERSADLGVKALARREMERAYRWNRARDRWPDVSRAELEMPELGELKAELLGTERESHVVPGLQRGLPLDNKVLKGRERYEPFQNKNRHVDDIRPHAESSDACAVRVKRVHKSDHTLPQPKRIVVRQRHVERDRAAARNDGERRVHVDGAAAAIVIYMEAGARPQVRKGERARSPRCADLRRDEEVVKGHVLEDQAPELVRQATHQRAPVVRQARCMCPGFVLAARCRCQARACALQNTLLDVDAAEGIPGLLEYACQRAVQLLMEMGRQWRGRAHGGRQDEQMMIAHGHSHSESDGCHSTNMHYAHEPPSAKGLINFVNASPSPFHAVATAARILEDAQFVKVREEDDWERSARPGGRYYFTRNQLALVAFTLPHDWQPGRGLSMVATHLDSPSLRVRPVSKKSAEGYLQVGVETYGGGIWHTWFDRDLSVAGRVVVKNGDSFKTRLVKVDRPLLRIPSLAVHLDSSVNTSFAFNQETQFVPVIGLSSSTNAQEDGSVRIALDAANNHHKELLDAVAEDLGVQVEDIQELELCLYDTQPATLGGAKNEFVFSARLDNLFSTFCAVKALEYSVASNASLRGGNVNAIMLFNHEEVGSVSTSGAQSSLTLSLIERLSPGAGPTARSIARSFLISSDVGHAVHPSYTSKHERNHKPVLNGGVAVKTNAGQSYTSEGVGTFIAKQLAAVHGRALQQYEVPNDLRSGSTVGPALSKIGMRTIDVGAPILSMHSIREQAGAQDVDALIDLFTAFFERYTAVAATLQVD